MDCKNYWRPDGVMGGLCLHCGRSQPEHAIITPENDKPRNNLTYREAMHGMQTGVAHEMSFDPSASSAKHLRVGINSALVNDAAMIRLLIKKGLITQEEYIEEVRLEANRELDRYEDRMRARLANPNINLR